MTGPDFGDSHTRNAAENYERYFVPAIGRPVAASLVGAAGLREGERVLDVACGTGIVARLAAEQVGPRGAVVGLDSHPGMLAVARDAAPPEATIVWREAAAEDLPLPDGGFDVVLCGMGLQFFPDPDAALREMGRVLESGGRLLASLPGPAPPPLEIMADVLTRHVSPESASFVDAVFSLHDADQVRALAAGAGLDDVEVWSEAVPVRLPPPGEFLWQYVLSTPLAAAVAQIDGERREEMEREFSQRCRAAMKTMEGKSAVRITTLRARA